MGLTFQVFQNETTLHYKQVTHVLFRISPHFEPLASSRSLLLHTVQELRQRVHKAEDQARAELIFKEMLKVAIKGAKFPTTLN